nr:tRNA threonylcarbamoyladenosine dehydratase [uncultured Solibaculum sp.]
MTEEFSRTQMLLGSQSIRRLMDAKVVVFGVGGVGSFTVEALARAGIGTLVLVDSDVVSVSNMNRQLIALHSTVGRPKVEVMKERILDINPLCRVQVYQEVCTPDNISKLMNKDADYFVDAIDTVSAKLALAVQANCMNIPIISCMGAGNKLDPTRFTVADIYETSVCPLCRVMRRELRRRHVDKLKVVYSTEPPMPHCDCDASLDRVPGSISYVPSVAGLILAGQVIQDIFQNKTHQ